MKILINSFAIGITLLLCLQSSYAREFGRDHRPPPPEVLVVEMFEEFDDGKEGLGERELTKVFAFLDERHREHRAGREESNRESGEGDTRKPKKRKKDFREMAEQAIEQYDEDGDERLSEEEFLEFFLDTHPPKRRFHCDGKACNPENSALLETE